MKNKIFTRIIITTLLCAFLTFNVGKVTRVSAVGTTIAASAAAALCAVGIVYCSYMALTGASVHVPDTVENIQTWLQDMGTKVVQYPSGRAAYEEIYPKVLGPGTIIHDFLDSEVWTWTADKLKAWANDFSSTDVIQNIASYEYFQDVSDMPTNGFTYPDTLQWTPEYFQRYGLAKEPFSMYGSRLVYPTGPVAAIYFQTEDVLNMVRTTTTYEVRNLYKTNGKYIGQWFNGTSWVSGTISGGIYYDGRLYGFTWDTYAQAYAPDIILSYERDYPIFPFEVIHDQATDEDLPMVIPESHVTVRNPQYPTLPPEDDNKPVIPYVKLPYDPSWIDPVTNIPGGGNWGFNLAQLLDALEDLAGLLMEIGTIGELINQFKNLISGQSGDEYYIYYDDSTNNYYQYYTITNFGDNIYNYDIDVSEADEHLPVDLNTIQTYSSNRYLEQIKQSAINGSSIVRDFAVFWYDVDPEVTYIALGICILLLIGAFTGKLGHS